MATLTPIITADFPQVLVDQGFSLGLIEQFTETPTYLLINGYNQDILIYNLLNDQTAYFSASTFEGDNRSLYRVLRVGSNYYATGFSVSGSIQRAILQDIVTGSATYIDPPSAFNLATFIDMNPNGVYGLLWQPSGSNGYINSIGKLGLSALYDMPLMQDVTGIAFQNLCVTSDDKFFGTVTSGSNYLPYMVDYNNGAPTATVLPAPDGFDWVNYNADSTGMLINGRRDTVYTVVNPVTAAGSFPFYYVAWDTSTLSPSVFPIDPDLGSLQDLNTINGANPSYEGTEVFGGSNIFILSGGHIVPTNQRNWVEDRLHLVLPDASYTNLQAPPGGHSLAITTSIDGGNTFPYYVFTYDVGSITPMIGIWTVPEFLRHRLLGYF